MADGRDIVKEGVDAGTVTAVRELEADKYTEGFVTDIEQEFAPKGHSEDTVRYLSLIHI